MGFLPLCNFQDVAGEKPQRPVDGSHTVRLCSSAVQADLFMLLLLLALNVGLHVWKTVCNSSSSLSSDLMSVLTVCCFKTNIYSFSVCTFPSDWPCSWVSLCLWDEYFITLLPRTLTVIKHVILIKPNQNKRQPGRIDTSKGKRCKPDGSSSVDLCHHLLPPTDGSIIAHFPQGKVLDNVAHSKSGAGATLVEGLAIFTETQNNSSDSVCVNTEVWCWVTVQALTLIFSLVVIAGLIWDPVLVCILPNSRVIPSIATSSIATVYHMLDREIGRWPRSFPLNVNTI